MILFFIVILCIALFEIFQSSILSYAYKKGNTTIVPACIVTSSGSKTGPHLIYDFYVKGEDYYSSSIPEEYVCSDSIDIIYLTNHPWCNMPADRVLKGYRRSIPKDDKALLKKEGVRMKVKAYIDQDRTRYAYKFIYHNCTYTGNLGVFDVNPNPEYVKDSIEIVFWPNNPNLNYASYILNEK